MTAGECTVLTILGGAAGAAIGAFVARVRRGPGNEITDPPSHPEADAGQPPVVTRLTITEARNGQPFFSPDGTRISFVSDRDGGWQVWSMGSLGGDERRLTSEPGPVGWPSWSNSGDAILFYGREENGYRLLEVDTETGAVRRLGDWGGDAFRPSMHPDGRLLLFDAVDPANGRGHDLYVRDLDTGRDRRLTRDAGYDSDARWSPDGRHIAFHSDRGQDEPLHVQVYVMTSEGGGLRRLTDGPSRHAYPSWSPNGRCLVYTAETEDGNRDLWVMDAEGRGKERLTVWEGFDGDAVWSPGGRRIVFATDRFGGGGVELAYLQVGDALHARCGVRAPLPG